MKDSEVRMIDISLGNDLAGAINAIDTISDRMDYVYENLNLNINYRIRVDNKESSPIMNDVMEFGSLAIIRKRLKEMVLMVRLKS